MADGVEFGNANDVASAEHLAPSMHKLDTNEEHVPLFPPDAKFLALLCDEGTWDVESAATGITTRSNSLCGTDHTFSTLCSNDFAPDEEERSPITPRKLFEPRTPG